MPYITELITVAILQLLSIISPGSDFAIVCRNSLVYSRKTGVYSAIGVALGILVHVAYSIVGIGLIISKSILLFSTIKLLRAVYLIYIGCKSLQVKPVKQSNLHWFKQDITHIAAMRICFLNNILNPKVTLFFFSLFTQILSPHTPISVQ